MTSLTPDPNRRSHLHDNSYTRPTAPDDRRRHHDEADLPAELQDQIDDAADELATAIEAQAAAERQVEIAELERAKAESVRDADDIDKAKAAHKHRTAVAAREAASRKVAKLERRLNRLRSSAPILAQAEGDHGEDGSVLAFPNADAWVRGWLLKNWRRLKGRWCEKWWLHAEAQSRFEALWRAWEHLRNDGALGPSIWWRDHGDYHLAILTAEDGPFARCDYKKHEHSQLAVFPTKVRPTAADLAAFIPDQRPGSDASAPVATVQQLL